MRFLSQSILAIAIMGVAACSGDLGPNMAVTSTVRNACAADACDEPPADLCTEDKTGRIRFERQGVCKARDCEYSGQIEACAYGCVAGKCMTGGGAPEDAPGPTEREADACEKLSCTDVPAPSCRDDRTRIWFDASGTCRDGACVYSEHQEACAFGCEQGTCKSDPCAGVVCATPPAAECGDSDTLITYASAGLCAAGQCVYGQTAQGCPYGCENGACRAPTCCGCLCGDKKWSCASNTCLNPSGVVAELKREVGFLELDTATIEYGEDALEAMRTRMWYAFFPADDAPETKPLLLFFNGGPGSATLLIGINTGPVSFFGGPLTENPYSLTRHANLLYVDPHDAGFSYSIAGGAPFTPDQDAALFTRTLLAFLKRHPAIRKNPIGIVGESYGGIRATIMLEQILHYDAIESSPEYPCPELRDELIEHFSAVFGGDGIGLNPSQVASQFRYQVLIQPAIGRHESKYCELEGRDVYQCDEPNGFTGERVDFITDRLVLPDTWAALWGADVRTVVWMRPSERTGSIWRGGEQGPIEEAIREALGQLPETDRYYVNRNRQVYDTLPSFARSWRYNNGLVLRFADNARLVKTLVTNAPLDGVVNSEAIPGFLKGAGEPVVDTFYDVAPRTGVTRPGFLRIDLRNGAGGVDSFEVRMPIYPNAGHMVTLRAPREFAEDVAELLSR